MANTRAYAAARAAVIRRKHAAPWLLLFPALVIVLIFFGLPTLYMARMSFNRPEGSKRYTPGLSWANYQTVFSNDVFVAAIWPTPKLALTGSATTLVIGYLFALLVWLNPAKWRLILTGLALCPLLISQITIIFG